MGRENLFIDNILPSESYWQKILNLIKKPVTAKLLPLDILIATSGITGISSDYKFGQNQDVDLPSEDVWEVGGLYSFPSVATNIEVVSTNIVDTINGIGANTIRIEGLNSALEFIAVDVPLNGGIQSIVGQFMRINRAYVTTCGSNQTNVGDINIRSTFNNNTLARISAGNGQTLMCIYTVPSNKICLLEKLNATFRSDIGFADIRILTRKIPNGGFRVRDASQINKAFSLNNPFSNGILIDSSTDIIVRAMPSINSINISASFDLLLLDL